MQVTKKVSVDLVITNAKIGLRKMKVQFPEKLIIAHLNFNYIRNNFDSLSFMIENRETHYSIQRLSWMFHFHQVNSIYVNLVYLIDMTEIHCTKKHILFFQMFWKAGLSKTTALEYDLSCTVRKDDILFSRKYDLILYTPK